MAARKLGRIGCALLAAALSCGAAPVAGASGDDPGLQAALDARTSVRGTAIVVGIVDRGVERTLRAGTTGTGRPLDDRTLFEIGSVTKTFTATALAAMVLAGKVRLDAPVATYLPKDVRVPEKDGRPITVLDLAEQRSGLPRMPTNIDGTGADPYARYDLAQFYAFLNGYALTRDPGAQFEYSNYGIGLLGQALAYRAGSSYAQLVQSTVLDPLGMSQTTFAEAGAADPPELAVGHDLGGAAVPAWHFRAMMPAGGILSDLTDMLKYLRCNMGQGPLAKACLFAQMPRADGAPRHRIGLVWWTNPITGVVSHAGDTAGFHAEIAISKDRQTGVVVMSNGPVVADIAAHVLQPSYPVAACPAKVPHVAAGSPYAGTYCNAATGYTFDVAPGSGPGELSIALRPQNTVVYARSGDDTFVNATYGAVFKFVKADGNVVGLRLEQGGQTIPAIRLDALGSPVVAQLPSPYPPIVDLPEATLREYVGSFGTGASRFAVTLEGGQLYVRLGGQSAWPVYPSARDEFFYKVVDAQLTFHRDAGGNVTSLTLHQDGQDLNAQRDGPI